MKLFMLPFSGGGSHSYHGFQQYAPPWLELLRIELSGHGMRLREPLSSDIHAITDDIFTQIKQDIEQPYAIFGHSLGATLGYLLCRKIIAEKLPPPTHLFVSGRVAPVCESDSNLHILSDADFIEELRSYGGIPELVIEEPELLELFLPILRADFQSIETYVYHHEEPFKIPVTAMIGTSDPKVSAANVLKWQEMTEHPLIVKEFTGDHFFIFSDIELVMEAIIKAL